MKRILLFAFVLILTACSAQPQVTSTLPPTSTPLPIPTETPVPTITPTSIPTLVVFSPETWAGTDTERSSFIDLGGQVDDENGVAWNPENGRVYFAKDAQGEWLYYPDGNMPIPPGPGFENEPPLYVPYYRDFSAAMTALTVELPWGEIPNVYRSEQEKEHERVTDIYWVPLKEKYKFTVSFFGRLDLHQSDNLKTRAQIFVSDYILPGGEIGLRLIYGSKATEYFSKTALVFGDPIPINSELRRIDQCVINNPTATNLAELCASEMLQIDAPAK